MAKFSDYSPAQRLGMGAVVIGFVGLEILARTLGMTAVPTLAAFFAYPLLFVPLAKSLEIRENVADAGQSAVSTPRNAPTSLGLGAPPPTRLGGRLTATGTAAFFLVMFIPRPPFFPETHGSGEGWLAASWVWWMLVAAFIGFVVPRWTVPNASRELP